MICFKERKVPIPGIESVVLINIYGTDFYESYISTEENRWVLNDRDTFIVFEGHGVVNVRVCLYKATTTEITNPTIFLFFTFLFLIFN